MTKAELMMQVALLEDIVQQLRSCATRYLWLREHATGMHMDTLAELDENEWDDYIDKAINRQ